MSGRSPIDEAKSSYTPLQVCKHLLRDGEQQGQEWVARNPTRHDESPHSFSVNLATGVFNDFADTSGQSRGTDVVNLWAYCRRLNQLEAAKEMLRELNGVARSDIPIELKQKPALHAIWPMPDDGPPRPTRLRHPKFEVPDHQFNYWAEDGRMIGIVCRWDKVGDPPDKVVRPHFVCRQEDGGMRWAWSGPKGDEPRPLYHLERLKNSRAVMIVEGEKTADRAQQLMPASVAVLSWLGGCMTADKVDLTPLQGRKVLVFPDHDSKRDDDGNLKPYEQQPGVQAAHALCSRLHEMGCDVSIVDYVLDQMPDGWDLADAVEEGWTADRTGAYIQTHKRKWASPKPATVTLQETVDALWASKKPYDLIPFSNFPLVDPSNSRIVDCWRNLERMLVCYGIELSYNEMKREPIAKIPGGNPTTSREEFISLCNINRLSTKNLDAHLAVLCHKRAFHPARIWIESQPWDGKSRIQDLLATLDYIGDPKMIGTLVLRWLVSAVAMIFRERVSPHGKPPSSQGVLVFTGTQSAGKTQWIESLAPGELVQTGLTLHMGSKDSEVIATNSWIVELGEIGSSFRRSDIEAMKAFLTRSSDVVRLPYGRKYENMPRRTVFAGTVNDQRFLADPTGNRRFWTIPVRQINWAHGLPMQQVWAEVLTLYRQGEPWHLSAVENQWLAEHNINFEQHCVVAEMLESALDWESPGVAMWWGTPADVCRHCYVPRISSAECREAAKFLRSKNCEERTRGKVTMFRVPRIRITHVV